MSSNTSFLSDFGKRLKTEREKRDISQKKIAQLLETSEDSYNSIEQGKEELSLEQLVLLDEKLGIDITYLLTGVVSLEVTINDALQNCPKEKLYDMKQFIKHALNLTK